MKQVNICLTIFMQTEQDSSNRAVSCFVVITVPEQVLHSFLHRLAKFAKTLNRKAARAFLPWQAGDTAAKALKNFVRLKKILIFEFECFNLDKQSLYFHLQPFIFKLKGFQFIVVVCHSFRNFFLYLQPQMYLFWKN